MKYTNLTYGLLLILSICFTSCVAEHETDYSSNEKDAKEDVKVQLTINFPTIGTRAQTTDDGTAAERRMHDVKIFTFDARGFFIETADNVLLSGQDGNTQRTILARLAKNYAQSDRVQIVALVNTNINKGINIPTLTPETSTMNDLYLALTFNYGNTPWTMDNSSSDYIPMWGVCVLNEIAANKLNSGKLTLERAIAKIDLTVNRGQGIDQLEIKKITVANFANQGYCTPSNGQMESTTPFIPQNATRADLEFAMTTATEGNSFVNRIYVPEQQNLGSQQKTTLKINATYKGKNKDYVVSFVKGNGTDYNILRNNIYKLNITGVAEEETEVSLDLEYEVAKWEDITVNIPTFD